ncbi:MAG TPA: lipoxygenase family protein [Acidimicrobiales bacterium]|nr:lipoxygenase family protein [Acidimicrobiales bacterium]
MWKLRKLFWDLLLTFKFRANKPRVVPLPPEHERRVAPIPLEERYPSVPIRNIPVADHLPADETDRLRLRFIRIQTWLYRHYPLNRPGLGPIDEDPFAALTKAYPRMHRGVLDPPVLPKEYAEPVELGELAVAGPYACYLERRDDGTYEWDFRELAKYEHHAGLRSLGCRVVFRSDEGGKRLRAVEIDSELGKCKPGDADWPLARQIALCAATNDLSIVRHFNWIHLTCVSNVAMVTRNNLPADHPLRRLLWPHVWGTHYSNELVTDIMLMPGGDFETVFSFTHRGLCDLVSKSYEKYRISVIEPDADAVDRGIKDSGLDLPYLENRTAHWKVMHDHASRYLKLYYTSDDDVADDQYVQAWLAELDDRIPNGIRKWLGKDRIGVDDLARLVAGFIYLGAVEHEVLGTGLWNYQLWHHVQPTRIYASGQREFIDVYQRLVNYNFVLNVHRTELCSDFSPMGLDVQARRAFRDFRRDLEALQAKLDREPYAAWKVSPRVLESGVNG